MCVYIYTYICIYTQYIYTYILTCIMLCYVTLPAVTPGPPIESLPKLRQSPRHALMPAIQNPTAPYQIEPIVFSLSE